MRLQAVRPADHQDSRVQYADRTLRFSHKVGMPGSIHQRQPGSFPVQPRLLGKDGDSPFFFHPLRIKKGIPMIHPALPPQNSAEKQHGFRQRRLPRIHMSCEPNRQPSGHAALLLSVVPRMISVRGFRIVPFVR